MLPATEEVVLQRVTLCGSAEAIDAARAPLKTALEHSAWPATAPGELLFLRRISASGNPHEIAARAAGQARLLADMAVDGWSAAATHAMAVRFHSPTSLLACLLRDLLSGTARHHWYWRRWQQVLHQPAAEAIVTLLQETPLDLPAIVAQLRPTTAWQPFWQTLGSAGAARLLTVAAQATGWSTTVQAARALVESDGVATELPPAPADGRQRFDLTFLAAGGTLASNDSRPLLAALLTLWQQAPATLSQPAGATQLQQLARRLGGQTAIPLGQQPSPQKKSRVSPPAGNRQSSPQQTQPASTAQPQPLPRSVPTPSAITEKLEEESTPPLNSATPEPEGVSQPGRSPYIETSVQGVVTAKEPEQSPATDSAYPVESFTHNFITQQGGLFYLLNFLNLATVRAQLPADQPGAGWRWLHDLATAFGCLPKGTLLEFLASECGLESGRALTEQAALTPMDHLLRLGSGRYGDEVWQSSSWQLPARLIASPSHVDLHFHLNDARLAVRRVGLDLNPGWLPWLGRVVSFHYGSGLEPERDNGWSAGLKKGLPS